jgi:hypothetical protein
MNFNFFWLLFLIPISVGWFFVAKFINKRNLLKSLDMSLFLIRLPRYEKEWEKEEVVKMIGRMEQIYANFLSLKKSRVVFEISSELGGSDISFYIAIPNQLESSLNKYIQGVYPGAVLELVPDDYNIFEDENKTAGSYLLLTETEYLPLNTYVELNRDPLESIANAITKISPDQGSSLQIVIKPAKGIRNKGEKILGLMANQGKSLGEAISYREPLLPVEKKEEVRERKADDTTLEAIRKKIKKPVFQVNIRLITSAPTKEQAENILSNIENSFAQLSSGFNGFKPSRVSQRKLKNFIKDYVFRNFNKKKSLVLNAEELTSVFHLPLATMDSPYIKWVKTGEAAPPSELPTHGEILIGNAVYRGEAKPIYIPTPADRRRHFYIIGQTGTGKSNLIQDMVRQDIEAGRGVGVIDPHGDLVESTLACIPPERVDDVVLFEPSNMSRPCGLNMLEWDTPEQKDMVVSEMIAIFTKLFPPEIIGPMFEHYMRNAMLALVAEKEEIGTLVEIPRIFTDDQYMEGRLEKVTDPLVRSFWLREWKKTTGSTKSDMLGYVVSKVGRFIENEMMRNIIGQRKSGFNLSDIMDDGKIFLANLSKGTTGELNSSLLGLILVSKMQIAAMRRARMSENERRDFYLYIDEFQNFTTDSISTILSEARKYRLNLILAHQYMPQLKEEIRDAVLGNVGTFSSFRIGVSDAEILEKQFQPEFSKFDLQNIDNFQYIVRLMGNNKVSSPFKIKTIRAKDGNRDLIQPIRELSSLKYGLSREEVEADLINRLNY